MYSAKNGLNANYGLWVIMLCQCRFISCGKRTTLVHSWGAYASIGQGALCAYGSSMYFLLNCAMNLKLL